MVNQFESAVIVRTYLRWWIKPEMERTRRGAGLSAVRAVQ
jgi:hypothetical protein